MEDWNAYFVVHWFYSRCPESVEQAFHKPTYIYLWKEVSLEGLWVDRTHFRLFGHPSTMPHYLASNPRLNVRKTIYLKTKVKTSTVQVLLNHVQFKMNQKYFLLVHLYTIFYLDWVNFGFSINMGIRSFWVLIKRPWD